MKTYERGSLMMLRRVLTTMVLLLGISGAAHAGMLATGSVYAGSTQNVALCSIFNAGTTSILVWGRAIIRDDGARVPLFHNNCNTVLPQHSCAIAAHIINNQGHSCLLSFTGSSLDIRGVLDIREGGIVLLNSNLR